MAVRPHTAHRRRGKIAPTDAVPVARTPIVKRYGAGAVYSETKYERERREAREARQRQQHPTDQR